MGSRLAYSIAFSVWQLPPSTVEYADPVLPESAFTSDSDMPNRSGPIPKGPRTRQSVGVGAAELVVVSVTDGGLLAATTCRPKCPRCR